MSQQLPKKDVNWLLVNWVLMVLILLAFLALGYDPIRHWLGRRNGMLLVSAVVIIAIIFSPAIDRFFKKSRS